MALEFITKEKNNSTNYRGGDVVITTTLYLKGKTQYSTNICFYHEVFKLIAPSLDRIAIAIDGTRLYFQENNKGWKLTDTSKTGDKARLKIDGSILPVETIEKGNYQLEYDRDRNLYFIDVKNKMENRGLKFIGAKR